VTRVGRGAKPARATLETVRKVFTLPESEDSTLQRLDRELSQSVLGFLRDRIVAGDVAPANLEQDFLDTVIPDEPTWVTEQAEFILDKVVAQSVHTSSPSFIGHMTSALPYFMVPLAKMMVALNQNVVKIETSKAFTPLERQVIGMLHRLVYQRDDQYYLRWTQDFASSLGIFCSGGTIANISALWVARNRMLGPQAGFPGIQEAGLGAALRHHGHADLAVLVSKRGHYSLRKAADLLGLGRRNLVAVDITPDHKIDLPALRREIARLHAQDVGVLAIVGIAGTTETGNVDPLEAMADIAAQHRIHFHVDAAWGGPTLFSQRYKHLLAGIERADSVAIDAHKQLYVPMGAGVCLFKDVEAVGAIEHSAQYVIRKGSRDIGKHTLEGSRPGMCMLVHSALRIMGRRGYELLIDVGVGKAGQFAKMIKGSDDFELITEPELNLLTYRYLPAQARRLFTGGSAAGRRAANDIVSELTESIQKRQRARGKTFVSRTRLEAAAHGGQIVSVLRVVLANPLTTRQILADILEEQRGYAVELMAEGGFVAQFLDLA
jgi:putative pyridoxal-dependent aspartate 1-decarboxylase